VVHHVRAGDTLWSLARRHGTTPERLAALNGLSVTAMLSLGQPLNVPATVGASEPTVKAARVAPPVPPAASQPPEVVTEPANSEATPPAPAPDAPAAPAAPVAPRRIGTLPSRGAAWSSTVVMLSTRLLGVPYRWGGTDPSAFDCSGFIYYVFQRTGVALPRATYDMFDTGTDVPRDQLQAGDVVFFQTLQPGASHAGIYLGDGRFIHSSSGFTRVTITPMNHRYYAPRYLGARRF
jgi:cell wall-associated NlpC family hydrolase